MEEFIVYFLFLWYYVSFSFIKKSLQLINKPVTNKLVFHNIILLFFPSLLLNFIFAPTILLQILKSIKKFLVSVIF